MTGNPYHDETGRFCSKGEMGEAVERLNQAVMSASNFEDFAAARDRYAELKGEYEEAIQGADDDVRRARAIQNERMLAEDMALTLGGDLDLSAEGTAARHAAATAKVDARLGGNLVDLRAARAAKAAAAKRTGASQKLGAPAQPKNTFGLAKTHTYKPAEIIAGKDGQMYSRKFTGSKAGTSYRSVTDYAKDIRSDLAEAQTKGYLPKNLRFSVVSSKYSGGQSLTVRIQGGADKDLYRTGSADQRPEWNQQIYTDDALEVIKRAQKIVDAYRWDASEPQTDYFNTNFYGFVNVEDERQAQFHAREKDKQRVAREVAKVRKELTTKIAAAGPEAYFNRPDNRALLTGKTKDGKARFGFVPGSEILLVEREHEFATAAGFKTETLREMYDMTGSDSAGRMPGNTKLADDLSGMDERALGLNLSRSKFFPPRLKSTRRRYA